MMEQWRAWLRSSESRDRDTGLWWSWVSSDRSGYPYEEATAWVLLAGVEDATARAALAAVLERRPLGRAGRHYLFDTGVALDAALRLQDTALASAALSHIQAMIDDEVAVTDGPRLGQETAQTHWSEAFGAHLLWLVRPLAIVGDAVRARHLYQRLAPLCASDGSVRLHGASAATYAHAAAYAAEGIATWSSAGRALAVAIARQLLDAAVAHAGLVPADLGEGPLRADVAAQAWLLAKILGLRHAGVAHIERALIAQTSAEGAIRYQPDSLHLNAWATAFALRAACHEELAGGTFVQYLDTPRRIGRRDGSDA